MRKYYFKSRDNQHDRVIEATDNGFEVRDAMESELDELTEEDIIFLVSSDTIDHDIAV